MAGTNCVYCKKKVILGEGALILEGKEISFAHEECIEMAEAEGRQILERLHAMIEYYIDEAD